MSNPFSLFGWLSAVSAGLLISAQSARATPINGQYNNQPGIGYAAPAGGSYTVGKTAQFNHNGMGDTGIGLRLDNSAATISGGQFNLNAGCAIRAGQGSHVTLNAGAFGLDTYGVLVTERSRIQMNGGRLFCTNFSVGLYQQSFALINTGLCYGGQYGVFVSDGSSALVKGGLFADNLLSGLHFIDAKPSTISGGTCSGNGQGVFCCSSKVWITGGKFTENAHGVLLTNHAESEGKLGPSASLLIDGGNFSSNGVIGAWVIKNEGLSSTATINGGTFNNNGFIILNGGTVDYIGDMPYAGGLLVDLGAKAVVNGGKFQANLGAGAQALKPGTSLTINGGDFQGNYAALQAPNTGKGLYIHSGAQGLINDGNFSNNLTGLQLGLASVPDGYAYRASAKATINGGIFHDERYGVRVVSGSECIINGGDFRADRVLSTTIGSRIRVFGGKFQAKAFDFDVQPYSTIELTGIFDGYDNSQGDVVIKGVKFGKLRGQLKNSAAPQTFSYRVLNGARLILHPTNAPAKTKSVSPSAASS